MFLFRNLTLALGLLTLLSQPALAATQPWEKLTPVQKEALSPLAKEWNTLPELQQRRLLGVAKKYPGLTPEQKNRLHKRLEEWSKLTPQQRQRAREKFQAFKKVPPETREQVKQMVLQQEMGSSAASGVPAITSSVPAVEPAR